MSYERNHFIDTSKAVWNYSLLNHQMIDLFQMGDLFNAYDYFGAQEMIVLNKSGFVFTVWAPNAKSVAVIGDFNQWNNQHHRLFPRLDHSGIWEGFIPEIPIGALYKFHIVSRSGTHHIKSDPFSFSNELRPATASVTSNLTYQWKDRNWMKKRAVKNSLSSPWNVYEMHLGSWMRPDKNDSNSFNSYLQIAELLIPYLQDMGFTHVEFMPVMEHPYDASWGYQCTGYFSASSRFGSPVEFMKLIDQLHQHEIGVILDWVPSHFPGDEHGLFFFDGAHTYEYADMRKGYHPDWNSYIFNYKRGEVQSFLISSAHFWLNHFHADAIRVDAVNSIIRLDYSRKDGHWEPNEFGTNENIEAVSFLKKMNSILYASFPDVQTIAEEATDWPMITKSIHEGGLGFGMKWMMGWMHDSFSFFKTSPSLRPYKQDVFTFSMMYYYDEQFMLPLSHDEVVHGKSPMIFKMPGNEWEKFANLRLLYSYMYTHPGSKLLFMGNEFGQTSEWDEATELEWSLLQYECHHKLKNCIRDLSHLYKKEKALYELQFSTDGFEWKSITNQSNGIVVYRRRAKQTNKDVWVILNYSSSHYHEWEMEIVGKSSIKEIFNSNDTHYWGTGEYLNPSLKLKLTDKKNKLGKIKVNIPALSAVVLK